MPRPIWSGAVSFGLVTIPIKVLPATESHNISFNQIHLEDGGRVHYQKVCELDGQILTQDEIGKGYEVSKDTIIQVTDTDLAQMPLPTAKAIEIVAFVPAASIDPIRVADGYYLAADGPVSAKPYTLLRKALERTEKVAVAKFAWHGRERLGLLRVKGDTILLHAMKWDDEIRSPEELKVNESELTEDEIDRALDLLESMTVEHLADLELVDHYRDALVEVIEAKAEHRQPRPADEAAAPSGQVIDLMAALEESVAKAKESRGETGTAGSVHEMPAPKKQAAAKKAPAKKAATKKAAAKKTTRKRAS
ncbi:Ku protein [Streptomyces flavochromogenes]|uniref:non-homologous end joining protein Ku n=1 Tax=Streptomyces flavochromogenes TaxID=68199 RepID=UPI0004C087B9|nr:Ku protein [Streptomyces flavochromogenes]